MLGYPHEPILLPFSTRPSTPGNSTPHAKMRRVTPGEYDRMGGRGDEIPHMTCVSARACGELHLRLGWRVAADGLARLGLDYGHRRTPGEGPSSDARRPAVLRRRAGTL